ncbi:YraN family protein [Saxibacter everestensis]|uniref:UPF0102 protein LWF01_04725 n=1 Tax=Saxibacter everestensis TaxID=2909229 RepID=A0ABY8QVW6_9MICO|nr:YraN family protein [Brevibacteriaceae bacterium ZFBP1038]
MQVKDELGRWGEQRAVEHVRSLGYRVLDTNWRCRDGEIDAVALDGDCLVVVEVKTRRGVSAGHPCEAITYRKLATLRLLAALWLRAHTVEAAGIRIDVIGIVARRGSSPELTHIRGAHW